MLVTVVTRRAPKNTTRLFLQVSTEASDSSAMVNQHCRPREQPYRSCHFTPRRGLALAQNRTNRVLHFMMNDWGNCCVTWLHVLHCSWGGTIYESSRVHWRCSGSDSHHRTRLRSEERRVGTAGKSVDAEDQSNEGEYGEKKDGAS